MKKRFVLFSLLVVILMILSGCHKTIEGRYYIKYEVDITSPYSGNFTYITVNTDSGEQNFNCSHTFSETFGPVDQNFTARIEVYTKAYQASANVRIYVCKGEEAFVLKKTKTMKDPTDKKPLVVEYKIDF